MSATETYFRMRLIGGIIFFALVIGFLLFIGIREIATRRKIKKKRRERTVLARKSDGTLMVDTSETGLLITVDLSKTAAARRCYAAMKTATEDAIKAFDELYNATKEM
jgi:hypothetical protein